MADSIVTAEVAVVVLGIGAEVDPEEAMTVEAVREEIVMGGVDREKTEREGGIATGSVLAEINGNIASDCLRESWFRFGQPGLRWTH